MITIRVAAEPSTDLSQRLAKSVTELTASVQHKDPTVTAVAVEYVDPGRWFVAGGSGVQPISCKAA